MILDRVMEMAEAAFKARRKLTKLVVSSDVARELADECVSSLRPWPEFIKKDASDIEAEREHKEHFASLRASILRGDGSARLETVSGPVSVWIDPDGAPNLIEFL